MMLRWVLLSVVWLLPLVSSRAAEPEVVRLWPGGAPGFEDRRDEPETGEDWWVANIHHPSLTVFPAQGSESGSASGSAVVIVPGGGHRKLVFDAEGTSLARRLSERGITAFVLKHRLAREENSPYQIEVHAKADGQRAMRWVRHHADRYQIARDRIGMVGFSAGGEVVSMVVYGDPRGNVDAADPIDRQPCGPNFQVLVYPGPLGIADDATVEAASIRLPPAFMVVASNDGAVDNLLKIASQYRQQKTPFELHVYAGGGHGFNLGQRSELRSVSTWPDRLDDWLQDGGWYKPLRASDAGQ